MGLMKEFLSSRTFLDSEHLEGELAQETLRYNLSLHSTTRQAPRPRLELKRRYLTPLPPQPYSYTVTHNRVASKDLLVSSCGNRYSVPQPFAQKKVKVKATPQEVLVFSAEGALIANRRRAKKGRARWSWIPGNTGASPERSWPFPTWSACEELKALSLHR